MVSEQQVMEALQGVMDPELHRSLVELGMIRQVQVVGRICWGQVVGRIWWKQLDEGFFFFFGFT